MSILTAVIAMSCVPALRAQTIDQPLGAEFDLNLQAQSATGKGTVAVLFNTNKYGYVLKVEASRISLWKTGSGKPARLGGYDGFGLSSAVAAPMKVTIKRRSGSIQALVGARLVLSVDDTTFTGGKAEAQAIGGAKVVSFKCQPIEPIVFADDFMRQPTETGSWTYAKGTWRIQTIGMVERGANPFSLESKPNPSALAIAGDPFWSSYRFECAAKGNADTTFGMCIGVQDDQNYYLLRWSSGAKGALTLLKVQDGKETSLATRPGGFIPMNWYQMAMTVSGGRIVVEVDHQRLLNVQDTTFAQGRIGLYSSSTVADATSEANKIWFDSVMVNSSDVLYDDFGNGLHQWQSIDDRAVGGDPEWKNYTVSAQVTGSSQMTGIPLRYQDAANFYTFVWSPSECQIISVVNGKRTVLDSSPTGLSSGSSHTVQAGVEGSYVWAAVDGKRVVETVDNAFTSGRTGFFPVKAAARYIRSFVVEPATSPEPFDQVTHEFTDIRHHPEMKAWAGPLNAWDTATFDTESGYWHKGNLYGNTTVKVPLIPQNFVDTKFGVILNGDGETAGSGYELDYAATAKTGISLLLKRQGKEVAKGQLKVPAASDELPKLEIHRQGRFIYVNIGSDLGLKYMDPKPLDGYAMHQTLDFAPNEGGLTRLGFILRGAMPVDVPNIEVSNRHTYAETFHLAPINWRPQGGLWEVTTRWSCQPSWTWYGGSDPGYCINWYKNPIIGDQSIDFYAGAKMQATATSGSEAWRDLNCSFCSDGTNLFSGYTVMVDGWNGTISRLYRKGKVVAESTRFVFPGGGASHRLWFDVSIRKTGGRIVVTVTYTDQAGNIQQYPLFDWTDKDPITQVLSPGSAPVPGGDFGFWTYNNGLLVSRAVLSYQEKGAAPVYSADSLWATRYPADAKYPEFPDANVQVLGPVATPVATAVVTATTGSVAATGVKKN